MAKKNKVTKLIEQAEEVVKNYTAKSIQTTHTPRLSVWVGVLHTKKVRAMLSEYLKEHTVVDVKTNGHWVCFLFEPTEHYEG